MVCGSFTQRGYGGVPTTWKARIAFTRYQNKFAFNVGVNRKVWEICVESNDKLNNQNDAQIFNQNGMT